MCVCWVHVNLIWLFLPYASTLHLSHWVIECLSKSRLLRRRPLVASYYRHQHNQNLKEVRLLLLERVGLLDLTKLLCLWRWLFGFSFYAFLFLFSIYLLTEGTLHLDWCPSCVFQVCWHWSGVQRFQSSYFEGGWHCWHSWYRWCQGFETPKWQSSH